jgi:hypothetical protein
LPAKRNKNGDSEDTCLPNRRRQTGHFTFGFRD